MQSFVVLGLIPGTNIQINFQTWLLLAVLLAAVVWLRYLSVHHRLAAGEQFPLRTALYANQLHRRVQ